MLRLGRDEVLLLVVCPWLGLVEDLLWFLLALGAVPGPLLFLAGVVSYRC